MRQLADNVASISRHVERLRFLRTMERLADYLLDTVNDDQTSMALTLPCDTGLIATCLEMERKIFLELWLSCAVLVSSQKGTTSKSQTP